MVEDYGITEQDAQVLTITKSWRTSSKRRQGGQDPEACGESCTERIDGTA